MLIQLAESNKTREEIGRVKLGDRPKLYSAVLYIYLYSYIQEGNISFRVCI